MLNSLEVELMNTKLEIQKDDVDLQVDLNGLHLKNPIMPASGTFGYGQEMQQFVEISSLGALVGKTITPKPRAGNPAPRMAETTAGMLNSIGLENCGIDVFLDEKIHQMASLHPVVVVNIAGDTWESYADLAKRIEATGKVSALELNLSCPNVAHGGVEFGRDPKAIEKIVRMVKQSCSLHVITKLTPNTGIITELAKAAEQGGTDSLSMINTLIGMAIDWRNRKPILALGTGGLSGPAIKPVALAMVYKCRQAVQVPIIGIGGISNAEDVLQFIAAGASAVQLGTINFVEPAICHTIIDDLKTQLAAQNIASITELIACAQ